MKQRKSIIKAKSIINLVKKRRKNRRIEEKDKHIIVKGY
jgi:hypothetical protein